MDRARGTPLVGAGQAATLVLCKGVLPGSQFWCCEAERSDDLGWPCACCGRGHGGNVMWRGKQRQRQRPGRQKRRTRGRRQRTDKATASRQQRPAGVAVLRARLEAVSCRGLRSLAWCRAPWLCFGGGTRLHPVQTGCKSGRIRNREIQTEHKHGPTDYSIILPCRVCYALCLAALP